MRISDCSSDVCSSDLIRPCFPRHRDTRKEIPMRTAILLATPLLLLAGCKIDAGTTTITNVSIDGKAQNVMRSYVNGGAGDFECIKSVSGRCHYLLFVRACDASAPAASAQPCAARPVTAS